MKVCSVCGKKESDFTCGGEPIFAVHVYKKDSNSEWKMNDLCYVCSLIYLNLNYYDNLSEINSENIKQFSYYYNA